MNSIGSRGWKIFSDYLLVNNKLQELIMLDVHFNAQPGCSAVVNAVNSAVKKPLPLLRHLFDQLGLYKKGAVRRKQEPILCRMPLASLEVLIFSFDLEDSLKLERQIRDGLFPSLCRVQTPDGYCLDRDGRVRRAVSALNQTMIAKTMTSKLGNTPHGFTKPLRWHTAS